MAEKRADSVTWKGVKFTEVKPEGLLHCTVYIAEDSELIKDGIMPTQADIVPKLQGWNFGYEQVNNIVKELPDVHQVPFIVAFVPDGRFRELTKAKAVWASGAPREFPDEDPHLAQIMKSSYISKKSLPAQRNEWAEKDFVNATNLVHEAFHPILYGNQRSSSWVTEEGLVELVPRLVLGYQHFMQESSQFLSGLSKEGNTDGAHPNKLHTVKELREEFYRYRNHTQEVNPSYGSAYLFMAGYLFDLQKRLVKKNPEYRNDMRTLNYLIKELSTPETPDAIIARMAEMAKITTEFLENSYYFQEEGQKWVEAIRKTNFTKINEGMDKNIGEAKPETNNNTLENIGFSSL
ncbi:MAG TPA: hypothetical protein VFV38_43230 [Ktedonobacteraceae bacterium]|nr:hypothetical protein [Ktedonobacteraceae bacterium]